MAQSIDDERVARFCELVEEEVGQEPHLDPNVGDGLGWFMIDTPLELAGETIDAEVDFELTEEGVRPLYAEIYVDENEERTATLDQVADQIDADLYEYHITEGEIEILLADLREAHAKAFG